jgi:hypothetical protein
MQAARRLPKDSGDSCDLASTWVGSLQFVVDVETSSWLKRFIKQWLSDRFQELLCCFPYQNSPKQSSSDNS